MTRSREWTYRGTIQKVTEADIIAALNQGAYYGLTGVMSKWAFVKAVEDVAYFRGTYSFKEMKYWLSSIDIDKPEMKARHAMIAILAARLKYTDPNNANEWTYLELISKRYLLEGYKNETL